MISNTEKLLIAVTCGAFGIMTSLVVLIEQFSTLSENPFRSPEPTPFPVPTATPPATPPAPDIEQFTSLVDGRPVVNPLLGGTLKPTDVAKLALQKRRDFLLLNAPELQALCTEDGSSEIVYDDLSGIAYYCQVGR